MRFMCKRFAYEVSNLLEKHLDQITNAVKYFFLEMKLCIDLLVSMYEITQRHVKNLNIRCLSNIIIRGDDSFVFHFVHTLIISLNYFFR